MRITEAKAAQTAHERMKSDIGFWNTELGYLQRVATGLAESTKDSGAIEELEEIKSFLANLSDELHTLAIHLQHHEQGQEDSREHSAIEGEMVDWYERFRQLKDDFYNLEARLGC